MENKTEPQIKPGQVVERMRALYDIPFCKNCEVNPEGKKPYSKRINIALNDLTAKIIEQVTAGTDIPEPCYICFSLSRFFKLTKEEQLKELKQTMARKN